MQATAMLIFAVSTAFSVVAVATALVIALLK